jgi:hypothetical protein
MVCIGTEGNINSNNIVFEILFNRQSNVCLNTKSIQFLAESNTGSDFFAQLVEEISTFT